MEIPAPSPVFTVTILKHCQYFFLALVAILTGSGCTAVQDIRDVVSSSNPFFQPTGPARIVIYLSEQRAYLYRGGQLAASTRISSGREGYDTPTGRFKVTEKDIDHTSSLYGAYVSRETGEVVKWNVDVRKDRRPTGSVYVGAPMPYFLRFHGGHGLHQGNVPRYPASHGCIRLPAPAAKRFYDAAKIGTPVIVRA